MAGSQSSFADFRLDPANACLWRGAQAVALTPKVFDVLHYLVTHADRLVTKDALLDAVWPETAVSEGVVRMAIGALRQALGDTARAPRYIATVQGRGYRFVAPVAEHAEAVPDPPRPMLPAARRRRRGATGCGSRARSRGRVCPRCRLSILPRHSCALPAPLRWRGGAPPAGRTPCLVPRAVRRVPRRCPAR